jgi:hypothetical protein
VTIGIEDCNEYPLGYPSGRTWQAAISCGKVQATIDPQISEWGNPADSVSHPRLNSYDTVLVEVPNPGHPYGVRGVGEVPIVPPVAALANAIYRATGKRMTHSPMSPGFVLSKLME